MRDDSHFSVPRRSGNRALFHALSRLRCEVVRRAQLLRGQAPPHAHRPRLGLFIGEMTWPFKLALRPLRKPLEISRSPTPQIVILMPGFATSPRRMRYMAQQLERAGHTVEQWGLGHNLGPTQSNFAKLSERICYARAQHGRSVVLVGWSLGGVFAREMAKRHPECVAKVITMGSPFSHSPYSNRVWRLYQLITGHSVESPPIAIDVAEKPPAETVAFWSPRDGIVSPRAARGLPGQRDRQRALRCSHMGFADSHEAIAAILQELG